MIADPRIGKNAGRERMRALDFGREMFGEKRAHLVLERDFVRREGELHEILLRRRA